MTKIQNKNLLPRKPASYLRKSASDLRLSAVSPRARRGFTLIEMLIALAIFTASVTGLIVVTSSGVTNANYAKNKLTATYLAQEGVETIRNLRDRFYFLQQPPLDWNSIVTNILGSNLKCLVDQSGVNSVGGPGCQIGDVQNNIITGCFSNNCSDYPLQFDPNSGFYTSITPGIGLQFFRTVKVENIGVDEIRVTSIVAWRQGLRTRRVSATENMLGWK